MLIDNVKKNNGEFSIYIPNNDDVLRLVLVDSIMEFCKVGDIRRRLLQSLRNQETYEDINSTFDVIYYHFAHITDYKQNYK